MVNQLQTGKRMLFEQRSHPLASGALPLDSSILSAMIHSLPLNIYAKNKEGRFIFANGFYCQSVEKKLEDILGKTDYEIHPGELAEKYRLDDQNIMDNRRTESIEEEWQSIGGERIYIQTVKSPLYDPADQETVIGTIGVFWDITVRKQAEIALAEERNLLRTLIDNIPAFIYVKDAEGRFMIANKSVTRVMGARRPDDLLGKTDYDFYPREQADKFLEVERRVLQSEKPVINHEECFSDLAGEEVRVLTTKTPLRNIDDQAVGIVGIGHDIADLKRTEEELRKEKAFSDAAIASLPGIFYVFDESGVFLRWNRNFETVSGRSGEEIARMRPEEFFPPDQRAGFNQMARDVFDKGWSSLEADFMAKDGKRAAYLLTGARFEVGGAFCLAGMGMDITDRKQSERERLKLKKLESVGLLAGGIAHDFNNLLTGVFGNVEMARMCIPEGHESRDFLESAGRSMESATNLTKQLLTFAKGGDPIKETL
ncbi:MAG: PAS domain-containing protein, partial [Desulfobacterales bacterium]|nr:PAS domain-containing protein [Desulfobacterales bacterium]